jgi:predicted nucleotidyltransferase
VHCRWGRLASSAIGSKLEVAERDKKSDVLDFQHKATKLQMMPIQSSLYRGIIVKGVAAGDVGRKSDFDIMVLTV